MSGVKRFARWYGMTLADYPVLVLLLAVSLTLVAVYGNGLVKTVAMNQKDMLPKDDPLVKSLNYLEDEFGGVESAMIVVEVDPSQGGQSDVKDVRDPRVMEYVDILSQKAAQLDDVSSSSSAADLLKVDGRMVKSKNSIDSILESNPVSSKYVSSDYSMTLVNLGLNEGYDATSLSKQLKSIVDETPKPPGVSAQPSGQVVVSSSILSQIGPDMAKTGALSGALVLLLVLITFGFSVRYSLTSLLAIIVGGSIWSFGLMGFLGFSMTSQTSAGLSMILGVGIDFGIQVVSRFRIEGRRHGIREGMIETMEAVTGPMSTTTLAALIGFRAMSLGQLTVLSDLATMMSVGVLCSMMAAITIVPSVLVLGEKMFGKFEP